MICYALGAWYVGDLGFANVKGWKGGEKRDGVYVMIIHARSVFEACRRIDRFTIRWALGWVAAWRQWSDIYH